MELYLVINRAGNQQVMREICLYSKGAEELIFFKSQRLLILIQKYIFNYAIIFFLSFLKKKIQAYLPANYKGLVSCLQSVFPEMYQRDQAHQVKYDDS